MQPTTKPVTQRGKSGFTPGDRVVYLESERGIVKSTDGPNRVYVVFNCNGDWDNYRNYTAALCDASKLSKGW